VYQQPAMDTSAACGSAVTADDGSKQYRNLHVLSHSLRQRPGIKTLRLVLHVLSAFDVAPLTGMQL
jgi:hypothetical protein